MYSDTKKNIANSAIATSRATTLAPVRVRLAKIAKGTSGARLDRSMTTKAASRTPATASSPSVRAEPLDHRVDEERQAEGDGHRAGGVEAALAEQAALRQQARGERRGAEAD